MLHTLKNSIAAFLIVCVMAPGFYMGMAPVPEADASMAQIFGGAVGALAACVIDGILAVAATKFLANLFSAIFSVPTNETSVFLQANAWTTSTATTVNVLKECILDALAWAAKAIVIEIILKSIVDWINSGFEGGPAFLSDPNNFFRQLAFATLDAFINESGLDELLCTPFKDDVMDFMMDVQVQISTKNYECSLDDIMNGEGYSNMVSDGNINFPEGGISGAMSLVKSGNNPYSAIFNVQAEATAKMEKAQSTEKMLLDFGNGHFSLRCDINNDDILEVCTPGAFVATQINNWMGGGLKQLENADEVSEIVGALVSTFVQKTLFDEEEGLLSGYKTADGEVVTDEDISQYWDDLGYDQNYEAGPADGDLGSGNGGGSGSGGEGGQDGTEGGDGDDPPGSCGKVYDAYGKRNGGRWAWRISSGGEDWDSPLTVTFSDGHTVVVRDTLHNYRESDGFVYKPGIGYNGTGDANTGTSHGGIYLHAPYGNNSTKARLCD